LSYDAASQKIDSPARGDNSLILRQTDEFLLLREMHHRVANTLMVLTSLLRREFAESASSEFLDSLARYEARIVALGNLHRSLVVGAASDWISVQCYLEHLCRAPLEAILKPLGVRCEVIADSSEFQSERCERLGLVIAELVMNAAKHAFHERSDGLVRIKLINRNDSLVCIVSDNGNWRDVASPSAGSKILKQLVRSLGGGLVRESGHNGTSVIVTCPRSMASEECAS
jgi:two-component sensor histidine kinase